MTRLRLLTLVAAVAAALAPATPAHAANRPVLHVGDSSRRICAVKWMISGPHGHRPNTFTVRGTYTRPLRPKCNYAGKPWGAAIVAYKFRIGYPMKLVKPVAGPYFFALLRGTKHRPLLWVALAQRRAKAIRPGPTKLALRIVAFETRQLGTREQCGGYCNRGWVKGPGGYSVDDFERYFGLRGLQWCGIFQRFSWLHEGADFGGWASNPYYVPSIVQGGLAHGYVSGTARVGSLVAFLSSRSTVSAHHVGMVVRIVRSGYYTIEGNSGDAARRHYYPFGNALRVFVNDPKVAA